MTLRDKLTSKMAHRKGAVIEHILGCPMEFGHPEELMGRQSKITNKIPYTAHLPHR